MTITPSIFEAFLKCPMKCWLRATNEQPAGNIYAEWVKAQNESYRVAETNRLIAQMPPPGSALSPPAETLKSGKWLVASDVVVRATGISRGSRSEKAPSSPSQPSQPGIVVGSGTLGNGTPVPSSALGAPDSTLEPSPAHFGAAPQPVESPPTCVLETCLHVVERVPAEGRGKAAQFIPIRFIFFNKLTKDDKLLMAFDALVLSQVLGCEVNLGKIVHGDDHTTLKVKIPGLLSAGRKHIGQITALLAGGLPPDLILNPHCGECEFRNSCRQKALEKDDLSMLGRMTEKERKKYHEKGIFTVTQLSYTFRPRRRPKRLRDKQERYHHSLKALAIREKRVHIVGSPELKIDGTPVYFDVEGLSDRDFYYLIGARVGTGESVIKRSFWAATVQDEGTIWRDFLGMLESVEKPVLIHYGSYETTFLKHMCKRHGGPPEGSASAKAVGLTVNLLTAIYSHIYFPTLSNGLKEVAAWLGFKWTDCYASGMQAIQWRHSWESSFDITIQNKLTSYNLQDCEAAELVARAVGALGHSDADDSTENPTTGPVTVKSCEPYYTWWGKFKSPIPGLEEVNEASRWDYQRDRIYVRSSKRIKLITRRSIPKPTARVSTTVVSAAIQHCPACGHTRYVRSARKLRTLIDVRLGRGWIRRRVVRLQYKIYCCSSCNKCYGVPTEFWPKSKYGRNLVAYVIYQFMELGMTMDAVCAGLHRLLGMDLTQPVIHNFKKSAARRYEDTWQLILCTLIKGKLVHADETRVSIRGKPGYVWVFTSLQEVVYLYAETREAEIAHAVLRDFQGVLVSDFYSAYDSLKCAQQKCLIHLIRDLNDAVLDCPFDEVLKRIVVEFTALMQSIIQTVDRRGLKSYFLRKHLRDVERFYRRLDKMEKTSEVAEKCRQRFSKNRDTLFTFLNYDGIPWNNNNAEHAIKAFARLRDSVRGTWTAKALREYLTLLSLFQTCTYMGVDFLDFLRSGEKNIYAFAEAKRRRPRKPLEYPPTLGAAPLGLDGSYWLDLFTGTTWREFRAAGARITGFRPRMRNSVARIRKGDILLCYLTGAMRWVGALQVVGHSNDRRPIWTESDFPERLEVKPLIVLEPEHGVPMSELAEKAPFYRNVASFKKFKGFLRGSPKRFKNRRNGEIILRMLYAVEGTPVSRAVGPEEPGKN